MRGIAGLLAAVLASGWLSGAAWGLDPGDAGLPGAFLTYGAGARALGMGRAFVGLADDATAAYWNPGGLSGLAQNQAIVQHVLLVDQASYEYLGYSQIFPYIGTLAGGLLLLNQGAAEGRDTYNVVTGDFSNQQLGVLLGFGTDITPMLAAGVSAKIVNQSMLGSSGSGFGLDLGLMYRPWPELNLGLVFQNLVAPQITLREDPEKYPMVLAFGTAVKLWGDQFKADLDVVKNFDQDALKVRFGLEGSPIPNLFLRTGIDDTEIGLGAGYRYADFQLDYALGLQTVEMMHKFSLSYYFGGFTLQVKAEPETFSPVGINKVTVIKITAQTKFEVRMWNLEIRNEANSLVKKYSGEGFPPDHIVWDGLADSSTPMPDGRYKIVLSLMDASGEVKKSADAFVNIQSILPLGVSPVEVLE